VINFAILIAAVAVAVILVFNPQLRWLFPILLGLAAIDLRDAKQV